MLRLINLVHCADAVIFYTGLDNFAIRVTSVNNWIILQFGRSNNCRHVSCYSNSCDQISAEFARNKLTFILTLSLLQMPEVIPSFTTAPVGDADVIALPTTVHSSTVVDMRMDNRSSTTTERLQKNVNGFSHSFRSVILSNIFSK